MAFTTDASSNTVFISKNLNMLSMEINLRNEKSETASHLLIFATYIYTPHHSLIRYTYSVYVSMFLPFLCHISEWQNLKFPRKKITSKNTGNSLYEIVFYLNKGNGR